MSLRRTSPVKILALILSAIVVVAGAAYGWFRAVESRRWNDMEVILASLERETESRSGERPVLYGEPTSGNAWEHYDRGLAFLKANGGGILIAEYVGRFPRTDEDQVALLMKQLRPALEDLRRGSRCATAKRAPDWRTSPRRDLPSLAFPSLPIAHSRQLVEVGRVHDAVVVLLDAARLSADLNLNADDLGLQISMAALYLTLDEIHELLAAHVVAKEDLLLLESGLERLDRSFPVAGPSLIHGAMVRGWELHRAPSLAGFVNKMYAQLQRTPPPLPMWRFGFSEKLAIEDYFQRHLYRCRVLAAAESRRWAEVSALAREIDREVRESKNPISAIWAPVDGADAAFNAQSIVRERLAQVRLLRALLRFRATGEWAVLDDPFGGKLSHSEKDGRLKIWSAGPDGANDAGSGGWRPRAGKDIVLEMNK